MNQIRNGTRQHGIRFASANAIESAIEHHSDNGPFRGVYDSPESYDRWIDAEDGGRRYGKLHSQLHEKLEAALSQHFQSFPIPDGYDHSHTDVRSKENRYQAYTYQNWDWFDNNSQVGFQIAGICLSRELIELLQELLVDEHEGWALIAYSSTTEEFDEPESFKILVTKESAMIPDSLAKLYKE
ncbi:MAG: hypothetical protein WBD31_01140 [Rubripirellula sp.]